MYEITVFTAPQKPSFTIPLTATHREIAREVARRFGFNIAPPLASSTCALPHSWFGKKQAA
jgi:hypothetical protein